MLVVNVVLLVWVVCDARRRGTSALAWGIAVAFLGPLGWLLYLIARPRRSAQLDRATVTGTTGKPEKNPLYAGSGRLYFIRGNYHYLHDHFQRAIKNYLQFLACSPADNEVLWTVYNNIGCSFHSLGDESGAEACKALWKRDTKGHDHPVMPVVAFLTVLQAVQQSQAMAGRMDKGLRRVLERQRSFERAEE